MPVVRCLFAGRVVILVFHEIQAEPRSELMTGTSIPLLEYALDWLQQNQYQIITLDRYLQDRALETTDASRYAILTFDDGYRDNVTVGLPILERYNAPFMMYVPTGSPLRTLNSWWLGLRELVRRNDQISIEGMNRHFTCGDFRQKLAALASMTKWIHADYSRIAILDVALKKAGISVLALNDAYFLNEVELQALSRHPLASLGGHTTSHAALATLNAASARAEMADNREYLQQLAQTPVRHFAYPYGRYGAHSWREQSLAEELGFSTAVTATKGHLDTRQSPYSLPRIPVGCFDTPIVFQARMNGAELAGYRLLGMSA
jgi:peptidoglycan/xylan/chitin deacetylase (PgdA/CDA1 family)